VRVRIRVRGRVRVRVRVRARLALLALGALLRRLGARLVLEEAAHRLEGRLGGG